MGDKIWELKNRIDGYFGTLLLKKEEVDDLVRVYESIEEMRKRWGSSNEEIDDAEEMWTDIPPALDSWADDLGRVMGLLPPPALVIHKAEYGDPTAVTKKDVTDRIRDLVIDDKQLSMRVDNMTLGGDPAPNKPKRLVVTYTIDRQSKTDIVPEGMSLEISTTGESS